MNDQEAFQQIETGINGSLDVLKLGDDEACKPFAGSTMNRNNTTEGNEAPQGA